MITGQAYGAPATLEVSGEALIWRAKPAGELPENICTTVHDVKDSHWFEQRVSLPGVVLLAVGAIWTYTYGILEGAFAFVVGIALFAYRRARPRRLLVLDVGGRRLVMHVDAPSARDARELVTRIERVIATGEVSSSPPTLP